MRNIFISVFFSLGKTKRDFVSLHGELVFDITEMEMLGRSLIWPRQAMLWIRFLRLGGDLKKKRGFILNALRN